MLYVFTRFKGNKTNAAFSDNKGSFIMNIDRNQESIDSEKIDPQSLYIDNLITNHDVGNAFLF